MSQRLHELFEQVQLQTVFPDGKTFVDCLPKFPEEDIAERYAQQCKEAGFDLKQFVLEHYELPVPHSHHYQSDPNKTVAENIEALWEVLSRQPDAVNNGSLIPLPHPYIVPGGRFGEIYYWDSYFTMLGLKVSGKTGMIRNMVNNFAHLVQTIGYIPNGNRRYYIGRSQPPFFFRMLRLLAETGDANVLSVYKEVLEKEYRFWMRGAETLTSENYFASRTVLMPGGEILNRYWDEQDTPRPESYREDVLLANRSGGDAAVVYRHLRAGAESGWDFSSRWFRDGKNLETIHTTEIVPVDLNCLLYGMEITLADACAAADPDAAARYRLLGENRKEAINRYCWNETGGFYVDYDRVAGKQKQALTLAGVVPLFQQVATDAAAEKISTMLQEKFLQPGGVVTTLTETAQQWDYPNGWAPLQWMTITGLEQYGFTDLAAVIARRWIQLTENVFERTGKLMEKYNVIDTGLEAGGGEYEGQDGFGWTNGVYLALKSRYKTVE